MPADLTEAPEVTPERAMRAFDGSRSSGSQFWRELTPVGQERLIAYGQEIARLTSASPMQSGLAPSVIRKAQEVVAWWDTGVLPDGLIKERAADKAAPWSELDGYSPRGAEREFIEKLVRSVALNQSASQSPHAYGPDADDWFCLKCGMPAAGHDDLRTTPSPAPEDNLLRGEGVS